MVLPVQVDAWGAFLPDRADLASKVKQGVIAEVKRRGIENLTIAEKQVGLGTTSQAFVGEKRLHTVFTKKLGGGAVAEVAFRVAKKGANDLELSWRLFEGNPGKAIAQGTVQWSLIIFGGGLSLVSLLLMFTGIGICTLPIGVAITGAGFGWWGKSKGKTSASMYQQMDSRALIQSIDFSLMKTLESLGVSSDELRTLVAASTEGIGQLQGEG